MRSARVALGAFPSFLLIGLMACGRGGEVEPAAEDAVADEAVAETEGLAEDPASPAASEEAVEPEPPAPPPARPSVSDRPVERRPAPPQEDLAPVAPAKPAPEPRDVVRAEPEPAPPPEPEILEVTVPEGTVLELELLTPLDSSVSRVGDEIQARTLAPVFVDGEEVLRRGALVEGRVTEAQPSGKVKGRASLGFTFDRLRTPSGIQKIRTSFVEKEAKSTRGKDAKVIGGGAGVGALIGGILGGKKGAAIGATIGGAGGAGVVLTTKGEEIRIPSGAEINVRLEDPVVFTLH